MILPVLVALLTALGPLIEGSWELRTQTLLHLATIVGVSLWLAFRIFVGHIPVPSGRTLAWTAALAALGAASAGLSPLRGPARHEWYNFLNALWLFPAMAALSKDQRSRIDEAIRLCGWVLTALAFHQHFSLREARPASALPHEGLYAGAALMFLALAAEKRDWLLTIGLAWSLGWTRDVGAWLGLSAALLLTQRRRSPVLGWCGGAVALACAVILYGKLGSPEVLSRWQWWKAAASMAADRPFLGRGPGTFASALPAHLPPGIGGPSNASADPYPLRMLSEYGIPFTLLWFAGLWRCVVRNTSHKRFGVIAVLIHSAWDDALSLPANLWLFAYFAASSIPDSPDGINVASRRKLPALLAVAGLGWALSARMIGDWRGCRLKDAGAEALAAGDTAAAGRRLEEAETRLRDDPEIPRLRAELQIRRAQGGGGPEARQAWSDAAAALERAVRLDPYRRSGWTELGLVYRRLGHPELADRVLRESALHLAGP